MGVAMTESPLRSLKVLGCTTTLLNNVMFNYVYLRRYRQLKVSFVYSSLTIDFRYIVLLRSLKVLLSTTTLLNNVMFNYVYLRR